MAKTNNQKKQKEKTKKHIKIKAETIAAVLGIIGSVIAIIVSVKNDIIVDIINPSFISYSDWLPYWVAGYGGELNNDYMNNREASTDKAFSLRSYIRNLSNHTVQVENIYTEIIEIDPIKDEVLNLKVELKDYTLKFYAINNGWVDIAEEDFTLFFSEVTKDSWYAYQFSNERYPLFDIASEAFQVKNFSLAPGEIIEIAEFIIDPRKFESFGFDMIAFCYSINDQYQYIKKFDNREDGYAILEYWAGSKTFEFAPMGGPGEEYSVRLFGTINVDHSFDRLVYPAKDASPQIEENGTYFIETVIAPDKSCHIKCQNVIRMSGREQKTEIIELAVYVPFYKDLLFLVKELSDIDNPTKYQIQQIAQNYRYKPEDIRENSDTFY